MPHLFRAPVPLPADACYDVRPCPPTVSADENREPDWTTAVVVTWGPARFQTTFRALWSSARLWLRFDCVDDGPWHTMTTRDDRLWEEEVVEVFLDPTRTGRDYVEIEVSPANVVCDLRVRQPFPGLVGEIEWNFEGLRTWVRGPERPSGPTTWTAVLDLPWTGFRSVSAPVAEQVPPRPGDRWHFNVFRIKRPGGPAEREAEAVYAAWSTPDGPSFHDPTCFKDLIFT